MNTPEETAPAAPPGDARSPVYGYLPRVSLVDFPGRIALVLFVSGCNFRCGYCHNAALLGERQTGLTWSEVDRVCRRFHNDWADGVVITGGEPTLHADLQILVRRIRNMGFAVKLDTNGSCPARLVETLAMTDYVAMDLKTDPEGYPALTGFADAQAICRSAAMIKDGAPDYEFRTTVLPEGHSEETVRRMAPLLTGAKRYVLQPFVPRPEMPDARYRSLPRTSPLLLTRLAATARAYAGDVAIRC
jgi:pyruvate formate lyase activating enzyme